MSDAAALLQRLSPELQAATHHPFLDAVRNGSLPRGAFDAWLTQDYLYVTDLLTFQARLLGRAPRDAQAVLVAGLVALEAELGWFEQHAVERGLPLTTPRREVTARYAALLEALDGAPYEVAITALWAIERTYLDAWRRASPGAPDFAEFVEHWTTPAFEDYVAGLQRAADSALQPAREDARQRASNALGRVLRQERDFWDMAWAGGQ